MYRVAESERLNMQRYFINQNADSDQRFFITNNEDIHHIKNVMRNHVDNELILNFLDQRVFKCKITAISQDAIEVEPIQELEISTELPQNITICSGLIKADKYEWMLQKATELGASKFIAAEMDRSIVKLNQSKITKKIERWQKIIKEAAEQSYRLTIPSIDYISNLKTLYDNIDGYDYILIAYEDAAKDGEISQFKSVLQQLTQGENILVIFGPEGGLSADEVTLFASVGKQIGLGPRILRAETAPLYVLSAVSYQNELLG